uniref:Uncharacterized protein n=1 Tax=Arion vulgaris TaxID=1028688 RepID=A0A0B7AZJ3_9EUPU
MDSGWKNNSGMEKKAWTRTVERELKDYGLTWETISRKVAEQQKWKSLAEALTVKQNIKRI